MSFSLIPFINIILIKRYKIAVRKVCRKPGSVLLVVQTGTTLPLGSDNHLSRPSIAEQLKQPTRMRLGLRLRPCSRHILSVLLQMGFTRNTVTCTPRGLLHHGSTLACAPLQGPSAVHFCGTILQLALTGRYPASCPVEPGLSSRSNKAASDCLSNFP